MRPLGRSQRQVRIYQAKLTSERRLGFIVCSFFSFFQVTRSTCLRWLPHSRRFPLVGRMVKSFPKEPWRRHSSPFSLLSLSRPAFYNSTITETLVQEINQAGGNVTVADFSGYQVRSRKPISGFYNGRKVLTGGAPTR